MTHSKTGNNFFSYPPRNFLVYRFTSTGTQMAWIYDNLCRRPIHCLLKQFLDEEIDIDRNAVESVAENLYQLSFDFYRVLTKDKRNLFFSPFCVQLQLFIACAEGKGIAEKEVMNRFNLPTDNSLTKKYFLEMLKEIQNMEYVKMQMNNKMVFDSSFQINNKLKSMAELFSVEADEMDFKTNSEACTELINKWFEEKTNTTMEEAIPRGTLNSRTSMLLLSALNFKGKWEFPFDLIETDSFYLSRTKTIEIEMMEVTRKFKYSVWFRIQSQFLEMPFMGGELSMLLILPTRKDGLNSAVSDLKNVTYDFIVHRMYTKEICVRLPKFVLEQTLDLSDSLLKLGIFSVFEEGKTDFSDIADKPSNLALSNIIQKSRIEVNEEGTENPPEHKSIVGPYRPLALFNCNRPFLFYITHPKTKIILYMGKYCNPDDMKIVSLNKELPIPYDPVNNKESCSIS